MKNKRIIFPALLLVLTMMLTALLPLSASAAVTGLSGSGTESDPYLIGTTEEMTFAAQRISWGYTNYARAHYRLTADIDGMTMTFSTRNNPFTGVFDGAGHTVTMNINTPGTQYVGLFAQINAGGVVKNVTVAGTVIGKTFVGGVCGQLFRGKVTNCVNTAYVSGAQSVGGVVGYNYGGTIVNCFNSGKVDDKTAERPYYYFGGVSGTNNFDGFIYNCVNVGEVSGKSTVGGLVGHNQSTLTSCSSCKSGTCGGAYGTITDVVYATKTEMLAESGQKGAVIDLLNKYIDEHPSDTVGWVKWVKDPGDYPRMPFFVNCPTVRGGTVKVNENDYNVEGYYDCSETVTLTVTPDDGWVLTHLSYNDGTEHDLTVKDGTCSFIMPRSYVLVRAEFIHPHDFEYSAQGNVLIASCRKANCTLNGSRAILTLTEKGTISDAEAKIWTDAGLEMPELVYEGNTVSITAGGAVASRVLEDGSLTAHTIKVVCGTGKIGGGEAATYLTDVLPGTVVTLTAGSYDGKTFDRWLGKVHYSDPASQTVTFSMPNEDVTVEAKFLNCYALSVFDGRTVESAPQTESYQVSVNVPAAPEGKVFTGWTAEGISISYTRTDPLTFTMPSNSVMLTAHYSTLHSLTIVGGSIVSGEYEPGKAAAGDTITIMADYSTDDARFKNWVGNVSFEYAQSTYTTFVMPEEDVTITVEQIYSHFVTVTGGQAYGLNSSGKAFPGDWIYVDADGWDTDDIRFTGWTGTVGFEDPTSRWTNFIMPDEDVEVTAQMAQSHTVSVTGGSVSWGLNDSGKAFPGDTVCVTTSVEPYERLLGWISETVSFDDAKALTTTFIMPDCDVSITAQVERITVTPPTESTRTYVFNGYAQQYVFADNGDSSYYILEGNVQTNAGTYTVTARLKVEGSVWADGTTADKTFTFTIDPMSIIKPAAYPTTYTYSGKEQSYILCVKQNNSYYYYSGYVDPRCFTVTGDKRTDAGTQTVTVTPSANCRWTDGTTAPVTFTFTIKRYAVPKPQADPRSFTYTGSIQTYCPYVQLNGSLYDLDGVFYTLTNRKQTNIGTYTVTATPRDNYCWEDGSTKTLSFTFKIEKKRLNCSIYYLKVLSESSGSGVTLTSGVDICYCTQDLENPANASANLGDFYVPYVRNAPRDASFTFYLVEKKYKNEKNTQQLLYHSTQWQYVEMKDLKPNTQYYMFAVVTCPGYDAQVTEITECSSFITSNPNVTVYARRNIDVTIHTTKKKHVYRYVWIDVPYTYTKKQLSPVKTWVYSSMDDGLRQALSDLQSGKYENVLIIWDSITEGQQSIPLTKNDIRKIKETLGIKSLSAPMLSTSVLAAGDPAAGMPEEYLIGNLPESDELPVSESVLEQVILSNIEFSVPMTFEFDDYSELFGTLAEGIGTTDPGVDVMTQNLLFNPQDTENEDEVVILSDPMTMKVQVGQKLSPDMIKEIEGYTFNGIYYQWVTDEEYAARQNKVYDNGLIFAGMMIPWDMENDVVTRDTDLYIVYLKDGATEGWTNQTTVTLPGKTGQTAVVTLPEIPEIMHYDVVSNGNTSIFSVDESGLASGTLTLTALKDYDFAFDNDDLAFTVRVVMNEDPTTYYDLIVHVVIGRSRITSAEVSLGADISINFYAALTEGETAAQMRFKMHDTDTIVDGVYDEESGLYVYTFTGITPQALNDVFDAELILDGKVLDIKADYSVQQYCENLLAKTAEQLSLSAEQYEAMKTLIADLLAYGAASQEYVGYHTDDPAHVDGLTPSDREVADDGVKSIGERGSETVYFTAAGLAFDYRNRFYVKLHADSMENVTVVVDEEEVEPERVGTDLYRVLTPALTATDFDKAFTVVLKINGEQVQTMTYSINAYCFAIQNSEQASDGIKTLAKAVYNYGLSAEAYAALR